MMTPAAVLISAIFVMFAAGSAGAQRDAPRPAQGTTTIRGSVVGADTQAVLRDVTVSLQPADVVPAVKPGTIMISSKVDPKAPTARPDDAGQFEFAAVQPGRYRLMVEPGPAAGRYLTVRYPDPAAEDSQPLTVSPGQPLEGIVIPLPRAAVITGRVVDENGNPMAFVSVGAQETLAGERRRIVSGMPGASSRTDDTGSFRLFGLRPGEYVLSAVVMRPGIVPVDGTSLPGTLPPMFYPGTPSLAGAARIRVAAGDEHGPLVFTLSAIRLLSIRGIVLDPNGQPASTVSVSIQTGGATGLAGMFVGGRTTASDGTFELTRVPPGQHTITVSHYAPSGGPLFAWLPITVSDDVDGLMIRLEPGVTVSGQVLFDGNPPVPLPTMYVRSTPARAGGANASGVMPAADLSFKLENQFGPVFIRTDGPPGWHLKSVLLGGRDVSDLPVEFAAGGPPLQVVLTRRAASLSGLVTTSKGVPAESLVILLNPDPATWQAGLATLKTAMTSADGKYRFEGLRPGRYLAVATMREDLGFPNPSAAFLEAIAKQATEVTIGDDESKTLALKRVVVQ
jgi:hypothetical protein